MTAVDDGATVSQPHAGRESSSQGSAKRRRRTKGSPWLTDAELLDQHRDRPDVGQLAVHVRAPLMRAFPRGGGYPRLAELVLEAMGKRKTSDGKLAQTSFVGPKMGSPPKEHPQKRWYVRPMSRAYSDHMLLSGGPPLDTAAAILNLMVPAPERESTAELFADLYEPVLRWRPDLLNRERLIRDLKLLESIPKTREQVEDEEDSADSATTGVDAAKDQTIFEQRQQLIAWDQERLVLLRQQELALEERLALERQHEAALRERLALEQEYEVALEERLALEQEVSEFARLPVMETFKRYERILQSPLRDVPAENMPAAIGMLVDALDRKHLRIDHLASVTHPRDVTVVNTQEDLAADLEVWREKDAFRLVTAQLPASIRRSAVAALMIVLLAVLVCFVYVIVW